MERLSTLDAEFLHVESPTSPMHIGAVCEFDGPAPDLDALRRMLTGRLRDVPRYRQRVRAVPLELGRPVWVDDERFRIEHHVHATRLAGDGSDADLCRVTGRLMSHPLDRDRPLWEAWLVDGLAGGRWALLCKVHHCMVDGIAGVQLLEALLDVTPDGRPIVEDDWEPAPEPNAVEKVVAGWSGLAGDLAAWVGAVGRAAASPVASLRSAAEVVAGVGRLARDVAPTPHSSIEGRIGAHRSWRHTTIDLAHVKAVRRRFDCTVNDVVLAAVSGGYRALLLARGDDPAVTRVRTAIPASVRRAGEVGANRVSVMLLDLPVDVEEPTEALREVIGRMAGLKASHEVQAGEAAVTLADAIPPFVLGPVSRAAVRLDERVSQRSVTTVVTNVPGPQFPLYCLGRRMVGYHPFLGLSPGVRVTTAVVSYDGALSVGVTGDEDSVPDLSAMIEGTDAAMAGLLAAARRRRRPAPPPG